MDRSKALTLLEDRLHRLAVAREEADAALIAARKAGATFVELAPVLGVGTPQAARWRLLEAQRRTDGRKQR